MTSFCLNFSPSLDGHTIISIGSSIAPNMKQSMPKIYICFFMREKLLIPVCFFGFPPPVLYVMMKNKSYSVNVSKGKTLLLWASFPITKQKWGESKKHTAQCCFFLLLSSLYFHSRVSSACNCCNTSQLNKMQ